MNIRRENKLKLAYEIGANVLGVALIFTFIWFAFFRYNLATPFLYKKGTAILILMYSMMFFLFTQFYGGYKIGYLRGIEIAYSQGLSALLSNVFAFFIVCLIDRRIVAILPFVLLTVMETIYIYIWVKWCIRRYHKRSIVRNITVIYGESLSPDLINKMNAYNFEFKVTKVLKAEPDDYNIIKKLNKKDGVALCNLDANLQKAIIQFCFENSMPSFVIPQVSEIILRGSGVLSLLDMPVLQCNDGRLSIIDEMVKRAFDIVVALVGIIVTSPIMLIVAVIIKIHDGGNVIFKQDRLTIGGVVFKVYKFRSMVMEAEKDGIARLAKESDSRITKVGKFIRKYRIDELPQLFNILQGYMSVVGPRPERPEIASQYNKTLPEFKYRLKMKAGLTGYAQVLGRYNTTPYDKLMWDLMYIDGYSFFMDLKIIMMTIKILFLTKSTQGVSKDTITADKNIKEKSEEIEF
ncbi:MAG: sugar transferase [Anaerotignaceae bacterium]